MSGRPPGPTGADDGALAPLAAEARIVVCCGSGGVGKTTTAAAFALRGARLGRRACVVTIDPAKRLANALGLDALTNDPTTIEGGWPGSLDALMLDPKRTFDDLVDRYSASGDRAASIKENRLYQSLSSSLSGTHEYMAMEKLYELAAEDRYDLIVVDTPPSRNALDFLEAPRRLTNFLSNRLFQVLMLPTRASLKLMGVAAQALLRTISKVAGSEIVQDAVVFFQLFEGMEEGFRTRAIRVRELLAEPSTAFVLVASPRPDSVDEAVHFGTKLLESGMSAKGLVVNRVLPRFAGDDLAGRVAAIAGAHPGSELAGMAANLAGYVAAADREDATIAHLVELVADEPVVRVPMLEGDIHDMEGLERLSAQLFGAHAEAVEPSGRSTGETGAGPG